ncbi:heptaprenyl diphosphate synthase component 1 [Exiguobacterium sp. MER 193]|uniref:heptaprenyl diphosphate synthase component 1 n=1 Tax=unclassified Exiguobacterium TaxID=2644629 RepID=UPI001BEB87C5|nr:MULTISPECIES: heptaprenyl diphosphate synthase component 1 [unclassified Exiguobacterium]MCM3279936.1 heptaprenyl diphosphate synthase component 1 [Exiguobacterium sp. MER 193]
MEQLTNEFVVTDLARQIETRMNHPYLTKHEVVPAVDMLLLRWMVEMIDLESIEHRQLVMATYFAHQALDLHDQVNSSPNGSLARQLKVLAGDFASAQFYKILTDFPSSYSDRFGQSVQRVNAAKCTLLLEKNVSMNVWLEANVGLIQTLSELIEQPYLTTSGKRMIEKKATALRQDQKEQLTMLLAHAVA